MVTDKDLAGNNSSRRSPDQRIEITVSKNRPESKAFEDHLEQYLQQHGYNVERDPVLPGGGRPDFLIKAGSDRLCYLDATVGWRHTKGKAAEAVELAHKREEMLVDCLRTHGPSERRVSLRRQESVTDPARWDEDYSVFSRDPSEEDIKDIIAWVESLPEETIARMPGQQFCVAGVWYWVYVSPPMDGVESWSVTGWSASYTIDFRRKNQGIIEEKVREKVKKYTAEDLDGVPLVVAVLDRDSVAKNPEMEIYGGLRLPLRDDGGGNLVGSGPHLTGIGVWLDPDGRQRDSRRPLCGIWYWEGDSPRPQPRPMFYPHPAMGISGNWPLSLLEPFSGYGVYGINNVVGGDGGEELDLSFLCSKSGENY